MKAVEMNSDVRVEAIEIGHQMNQAGLSKQFIASAVELAFKFEGIYNLMKMWADEADSDERDETVAEIQGLIDDIFQPEKNTKVHIRFDDLDEVAKDIRRFKDNLREIVDKRGGIGKLALLTGIPQPSLSRFFNSGAMPRRNTLIKISKALKLGEIVFSV